MPKEVRLRAVQACDIKQVVSWGKAARVLVAGLTAAGFD